MIIFQAWSVNWARPNALQSAVESASPSMPPRPASHLGCFLAPSQQLARKERARWHAEFVPPFIPGSAEHAVGDLDPMQTPFCVPMHLRLR